MGDLEDKQLTWSDLLKCDIKRFRDEESGQLYDDPHPFNYYIGVLRKLYISYPWEVRHGGAEPDPEHNSNIFMHHLKEAEEKMHKSWTLKHKGDEYMMSKEVMMSLLEAHRIHVRRTTSGLSMRLTTYGL